MNGQLHALADLLSRKSPKHQMVKSIDSLDMMAEKNISNASIWFEPLTYRPQSVTLQSKLHKKNFYLKEKEKKVISVQEK
jgi:hypothetical protein